MLKHARTPAIQGNLFNPAPAKAATSLSLFQVSATSSFSFPSICYPFCQLLAIAELKEIKAFVDILPALS